MTYPVLKPGDIFLTRGTSFISRAIRVFTRTFGESRTKINHVGLVVAQGTAAQAQVVEALWRVVRRRLWDGYGPPSKDEVAVYRPINLTDEELAAIVAYAERQVGKQYGYLKIAAHLLDWGLMGTYLFRRLTQSPDYPICSWLVAHAYASVSKDFGVVPGAATPDDIWDFVTKESEKYRRILLLGRLELVVSVLFRGAGISGQVRP